MLLSQFRVGVEFTSNGGRWRCTDVGTRVVAAIRVDRATITSTTNAGALTSRTISGAEAEAIGWFSGPPYGVVEHLFDEDDQEICEPVEP